MNADNYFQSDEILNIINKNYNEKIANLRVLNSFKTLYDITGKYEKNDKSYEEVISDSDSRIEFLINSVTIALTNKKIDNKTSGIIIQLYTSLYNYLMNKSSLEEITIPKEIKNKIHDKNYLPKREELKVLMTLIYSNKKIFDNEFDGVDFSQTITNGLHKNITEILRIERRNISHLLGLTSSDSSLYSFYKKAVIDKIINNIMREINWDGSNDIEKIKIFNKKFKEVFKLDFTKENYSKIIMWRYKSEKDLKRKLTPEEEILNEITALAPKEKTIDFYADKQNINKLLDENEKVNNFVYSYIRNELILKKLNNPNTRKSILRRFEDTNKLSVIQNPKISIEDKNIRVILDNYVRQYENLADNKDFKEKFINKFNYSYPLIEFDKLITKNISFYNFSLFENLNSIVLDYNPEVKNEKMAKHLIERRKRQAREKAINSATKVTLDNLFTQMEQGNLKVLNLIVKADVQGSVEAVKQAMEKLENEEVKVKVIHAAAGAVNQSDVTLAKVSNAIIIAFNVRPDNMAKEMAEKEEVQIKQYSVIYQAIEEVEAAMKGMLAPKYEEKVIGNAEVRQTFKISNVGTIAGCYVISGKVERNAGVRVIRENVVIHDGHLATLKRFKDDVKEVTKGFECGIQIENYNDIKEGDVIEVYIMEEIKR